MSLVHKDQLLKILLRNGSKKIQQIHCLSILGPDSLSSTAAFQPDSDFDDFHQLSMWQKRRYCLSLPSDTYLKECSKKA